MKRRRVTDLNEDLTGKEQHLLLQGCSHPHLQAYQASFYVDKAIYTVLKATDTTLASLLPLRGGTKAALAVFSQVCSGVAHLHRGNMCYGIMNSRNVYVQERGQVFLGVEHVYEVNRHLKLAIQDSYQESLPYMAPESYFSKAGDVWSLGVLLHEMLTGDLPLFDRQTNTIVLN